MKEQTELRDAFTANSHIFEDEVTLGFANAKAKALEIILKNEFFTSGMYETNSFYICYTKRKVDDEYWGFLTKRNGYCIEKNGDKISIPGNPVLRHSSEDGSF